MIGRLLREREERRSERPACGHGGQGKLRHLAVVRPVGRGDALERGMGCRAHTPAANVYEYERRDKLLPPML
eukprot:6077126-Prymnesium_polylepis.1